MRGLKVKINLTEQEMQEYAIVLLEQLSLNYTLDWLEMHFSEEDKNYHKTTAVGCVRIKNDIDKRMADYRASK